MATYFKYAEREADSYINWAEIGKDMSEMITTENRIREEKKDAIDQASREYGNVLSEPPQGEHKEFNQWSLEFGSDAQQARLMQDQLLKSGQLKLKDYLVMRQNMTDGTDRALELMKEYNAEYSRKMERTKAEENQDLEPWLMGEAEGFANFSQTKLYINPTDGTISVAKMVKGPDGVMTMSKDPNDFTTVNALRNRIKGTFDKFDVAANVGTYVKSLGEQIDTITKIKNKYDRGTITEILDITQRDGFKADEKGIIQSFEDVETKMLESMLANPYNISSVLTNSVNFDPKTKEEYTYTWSEQEAKDNPNLILLKNDPKSNNPMPQFSDDQRKVALEHLRTQARLMYDKTEKVTVVGANEKAQTPEWKTMSDEDKKNRRNLLNQWMKIRNSSTASEKDAAAEALKGSLRNYNTGIIDIDPRKDGVFIQYADGKTDLIEYKADGQDKTGEGWAAAGTILHGIEVQEEYDKYKGSTFMDLSDQGWESVRASYTMPKGTSTNVDDVAYSQYVAGGGRGNFYGYIVQDDPDATVEHLRNRFSQFGFTFSPGDESITIIPSVGEAKTFTVDDQSDVAAIQSFLKGNAVNKELVPDIYKESASPAPTSGIPASGGSNGNSIFGLPEKQKGNG
jgi:hypothetical protein